MYIYIWGAGKLGHAISDRVKSINSTQKVVFIDNDYVKCQEGLAITPEEYIQKKQIDDFLFVPKYHYSIGKEIINQIRELGVAWGEYGIVTEESIVFLYQKYGNFNDLKSKLKGRILYIDSIEYEVARHCNLNCNGCNHFSPFEKEYFGNIDLFERDLAILREKIEYLSEIRLLGGEPLLNENLKDFIVIARKYFKESKIHILTNGLLLLVQNKELFKVVKDTDSVLGITVYPPILEHINKIIEKLNFEGVNYDVFKNVSLFSGQINLEGNSSPNVAEGKCYSATCHIIEDGIISKCTVAHKIKVFNDKFNKNLPQTGISLENCKPEEMWRYLTEPVDMCRYCGKYNNYIWNRYEKENGIEAWLCKEKY